MTADEHINAATAPAHSVQNIDALIFDMDGTLWDAVDSYCIIWDKTLDEMGVCHRHVTRTELLGMMGMYLNDIIARLAPEMTGNTEFLARLEENEARMMPVLGGRLYPGAKAVIEELSHRYRLFMVSNCGPFGLDNFVNYTELKPYFTDLLSHGMTRVSKAENIRTLCGRYGLKRAVYVGDTAGDGANARAAGAEIIWAAYGFGHIDNPDAVINDIRELPDAVAALDKTKPRI